MADLKYKIEYDITQAMDAAGQLEGRTSRMAQTVETVLKAATYKKAFSEAFRYAGEAVDLFAKDNINAQNVVKEWDAAADVMKKAIGKDLVGVMNEFKGPLREVMTGLNGARENVVDYVAAVGMLAGGKTGGYSELKRVREIEEQDARDQEYLNKVIRPANEKRKAMVKEATDLMNTAAPDAAVGLAESVDPLEGQKARIANDRDKKIADILAKTKDLNKLEREGLKIEETIQNIRAAAGNKINELDVNKELGDTKAAQEKLDNTKAARERLGTEMSGNILSNLRLKGLNDEAEKLSLVLQYEQSIKGVMEDQNLSYEERVAYAKQFGDQRDAALAAYQEGKDAELAAKREGSQRSSRVISGEAYTATLRTQLFGMLSGGTGQADKAAATAKNTADAVNELKRIGQLISNGGLNAVATYGQ